MSARRREYPRYAEIEIPDVGNIPVIITRRCILIPESEYGEYVAICLYPYRGKLRWRIWRVSYPPFRFRRHIRCFTINVSFTLYYIKRKDETRNIKIEAEVSCVITDELLEKVLGLTFVPERLIDFIGDYIERSMSTILSYVEEVYGTDITECEYEFGIEILGVCREQPCQCVFTDYTFERGRRGYWYPREEPASRELAYRLSCFDVYPE